MKTLFVHIPKCAGSFVENYLTNNNINHEYYCHKILKCDIHLYKNYNIITSIRNPIDRFVSLYFYINDKIKNLSINQNEHKSIQFHIDLRKKYNINNFKDYCNQFENIFIENILPDYNNLKYINHNIDNIHNNPKNGFYPQSWFICDNNNKLLVNKVFIDINLNDQLNNYFNKINTYDKINTSIYNEKCDLDVNTINILKKIYKNDFDLYNRFKV